MSTKISKGARLHLLRVVENVQYPVRWHVFRPDTRKRLWRALAMAFTLRGDPSGRVGATIGHDESP